jgi:hypothetical protein
MPVLLWQKIMTDIYIKANAICTPDLELLQPFGLEGYTIDKSLIPITIRRRTALSTRMAITAATMACRQAQTDRSQLTSIFVSLGGEIQITDTLCRLLPDKTALLSPTQFHNSVHNTTAGYWGILNHCQQPSTAIAANDDGFAMGLLEAWSQLQQTTELLLVCYDELWPQYLAPPIGSHAFACAFVLTTHNDAAYPSISVPKITKLSDALNPNWRELVKKSPATAAIPLLQAIKQQQNESLPLNINSAVWQTHLTF